MYKLSMLSPNDTNSGQSLLPRILAPIEVLNGEKIFPESS
jgi:hypothetical protein